MKKGGNSTSQLPNFSTSSSGFTLIELLVVLILMVIASGIAGILIYRGSGNIGSKTFTKEISAALRYARSHAITEKKIYSFSLSKDEGLYKVYSELSGDTAGNSEEEIKPVITKPLPKTLEILFKDGADSVTIDFFPQGHSSGGYFEIMDGKNRGFAVNVNRVSGIVTVENLK